MLHAADSYIKQFNNNIKYNDNEEYFYYITKQPRELSKTYKINGFFCPFFSSLHSHFPPSVRDSIVSFLIVNCFIFLYYTDLLMCRIDDEVYAYYNECSFPCLKVYTFVFE